MQVRGIAPHVGATIRSLRKERGLTQQHVADHLGVHVTHLSKIENGATRPGYELVERLAAILAPGDPLCARSLHIRAGHLPLGFEERMRTDVAFARKVWDLVPN